MKAIIISIYPPRGQKHANTGGVASYTKNLVTNFPRRDGDEIFLLANKLEGKRDEYLEDGIQVVRCFDRNPKFFFQLLQEVKRINPDVVHVQQELALFGNIITAYLLQWFLFLLRSYRTAITLHGVVSLRAVNKDFVKENNSRLPVWLVKIAFYVIYKPLCIWSKKIIVHEQYFKDILIGEYGVGGNKIEVIYHGVEDFRAIEREEACRQLELDPKKDICLFLGYFTGYKGLDLLVEGFAEYARVNPNTFLLVGSGKHPKLKDDPEYLKGYEAMRKKTEELIPAGQCRWVGFVEEKDITAYYSASDVSIYPYTISMSSSGPMAIAIGHEKPFLASDVFSQVFDPLFIFKRDKQAVKEKIEYYFNNKDKFQGQVNALRKSRLWSEVGRRTWEEVYEKDSSFRNSRAA